MRKEDIQERIKDLPIEKQLECLKIESEISKNLRPFYLNSSFYASISPVVIGLLGLVFSWNSGWFETQNQKLENQKILLEAQTIKLESEKHSIELQIENYKNKLIILQTQKDSLTKVSIDYKKKFSSLSNSYKKLTSERDLNENQRQELNSLLEQASEQIDSLQSALENSSIVEESKINDIREAIVSVSLLNLRSARSLGSPTLGPPLPAGTVVKVISEGDEWAQVNTSDGRNGWVIKRYLN